MNDEKRFELYEKLYFREVEAREKMSSRLQIPLVLLLSLASLGANLIKGFSLENSSFWNQFFNATFLGSVGLFVISATYFIRAFWRHEYTFMPTGLKTENYRNELINTYSDYAERDELVNMYFNEYIFRYYNECSSANTIVNDKRSELLHKCTTYLIGTSFPLVTAFLIFTLAGIDKNAVLEVLISKPIEIKTSENPFNIDGNLGITTLEVDYSDDVKELLNEQKAKIVNAATPSGTPSKENP